MHIIDFADTNLHQIWLYRQILLADRLTDWALKITKPTEQQITDSRITKKLTIIYIKNCLNINSIGFVLMSCWVCGRGTFLSLCPSHLFIIKHPRFTLVVHTQPGSYRLLPVENVSVHGLPALELQLHTGLSTQSNGLDLTLCQCRVLLPLWGGKASLILIYFI